MLPPTPSRILRHSATLKVASGKDNWGANTYTEYALTHVCFQPTNQTRKTTDNTTVLFVGLMVHDARLSSPKIDFDALKRQADAVGGDMKLVFGGTTYTVQMVDSVYDDMGVLHHTELLLT